MKNINKGKSECDMVKFNHIMKNDSNLKTHKLNNINYNKMDEVELRKNVIEVNNNLSRANKSSSNVINCNIEMQFNNLCD